MAPATVATEVGTGTDPAFAIRAFVSEEPAEERHRIREWVEGVRMQRESGCAKKE
jgi:hypothetical protein